ncbi:response regulator transcription factor [Chloroflexota bacterium]
MKSPRILLVDDDPTIMSFLSANFQARNFDVIQASDGASALKLAAQTQPDLVILDVVMEGLDGMTVCHCIRKWSDVPIIFLTARDELCNKLAGFELGADDYITKPFIIEELLAHVYALMRRGGNQDWVDTPENHQLLPSNRPLSVQETTP